MNEEKYFYQEESRLFSVKSVVAFDSENGEVPIETATLPITGLDDLVIGYGNVYASGNKLIAEGSVDYSSPERLLIETKSIPLFLHVIGNRKGNVFTPTKLEISPDKPLDPRRAPLGEIVL